jgi:hypothetical protein
MGTSSSHPTLGLCPDGCPATLPGDYPMSRRVDCDDFEPTGPLQSTVGADGSGLVFEDGRYTYEWKTQKSWGGTCRKFVLKLIDGTTHTAIFRFVR